MIVQMHPGYLPAFARECFVRRNWRKRWRMQYGDITKADNPFRILSKPGKINLVNHPDGAIAATRGYNGFNTVIINKTLQVPGPKSSSPANW
jgi:hypothetical protein